MVDLLDRVEETVEVDGLRDVGIGVQLVAAEHVLLRLRRGEDDDRDVLQLRVGLDLRQHLAPVAAGQVEVEQDQVGPGHVRVRRLLAQVGQRLGPVGDDVEPVVQVVLEGLPGHQHVSRVVLDQQDVDDPWLFIHQGLGSSEITGVVAGRVNSIVAPGPGVVTRSILPSWNSTIFLARASPMPVPA